jgi:hypothetical protein
MPKQKAGPNAEAKAKTQAKRSQPSPRATRTAANPAAARPYARGSKKRSSTSAKMPSEQLACAW